MGHSPRLVKKIVSPNGNTLDLESKSLPAGMQMGGEAIIGQSALDSAIAGHIVTDFPNAVAVITNVPTYTYDNGAGTITADANGAWLDADSDGVTLSVGEDVVFASVWLSGITDEAHAGLYELTQVGDGSNPFIFTRCPNADESSEFLKGKNVRIDIGGATCGRKVLQYQGDSNPTIGTDPLNFTVVGDYSLAPGSVGNAEISDVAASKVTGTMSDAQITESSVTQHEAALSISSTQITGLDTGSFVLGDADSAISAKSFVYLDPATNTVKEATSPIAHPVYYTVSGMGVTGFPVTVETKSRQPFGLNVETSITLAEGDKLYLSASEAGKVTNVAPANAVLVGYYLDATGFGTFILHDQTQHGDKSVKAVHLNDDIVGEAHLDGALTSQVYENNEKSWKVNVTHASASLVEVIPASALVSGDDVLKISVRVNTAFNGTGMKFDFGTPSSSNGAIAADAFDLSMTGLQTAEVWYTMTASEAVNCYFTNGGSGAGDADIIITRYRA